MERPSLNSKYTETKNREFFGDYDGLYLKHIYERVQEKCPKAINVAVEIMCTTSRGFGHNRFRSKISRQLKHVDLTEAQKIQILSTILTRFSQGDIDEQFIEQLRFALTLDRDQTVSKAKGLQNSDKEYVKRYANKLLNLGGAHEKYCT